MGIFASIFFRRLQIGSHRTDDCAKRVRPRPDVAHRDTVPTTRKSAGEGSNGGGVCDDVGFDGLAIACATNARTELLAEGPSTTRNSAANAHFFLKTGLSSCTKSSNFQPQDYHFFPDSRIWKDDAIFPLTISTSVERITMYDVN
jgi:hypothetical protein